jgi:hypothetical protein
MNFSHARPLALGAFVLVFLVSHLEKVLGGLSSRMLGSVSKMPPITT